MGIEPKVSHAQSKLGTVNPQQYWFERPYMYIKYIFVNIVHHNYRMLLFAVSIKNIVDMSDIKQFVKTRAQPPSHVAVAKTRYATRRPGYINSFIIIPWRRRPQ